MFYQFQPVDKVYYGIGVVKNELLPELKKAETKKVLIVTTKSLTTTKVYQMLMDLIDSNGMEHYTVLSKQHVPGESLMKNMEEIYTFSPELIISCGGGSAIDAGKILALALSENVRKEEELYPFSENRKEKALTMSDPVPHITIPTTLSAAEFTSIAGTTNSMDQLKYKFSHENMTPKYVFLDPEFTIETPEWLWLSTGMRAVDHAVETLYSPQVNPVNTSLALTALEKLYQNLKRSKQAPENLEYRLECQIGAWLSLFSNVNIKLGLSHSIGHQLGALFGIPHGMTSAIMLPHVMRFLLPRTYNEQVKITETLGQEDPTKTIEENAKVAARLIQDLVIDLEIPHRLRDFGVTKEGMNQVIQNILVDIKGEDNSFVTEMEDLEVKITKLLEEAW